MVSRRLAARMSQRTLAVRRRECRCGGWPPRSRGEVARLTTCATSPGDGPPRESTRKRATRRPGSTASASSPAPVYVELAGGIVVTGPTTRKVHALCSLLRHAPFQELDQFLDWEALGPDDSEVTCHVPACIRGD